MFVYAKMQAMKKPPKRSDAQAHRALLLDAADHVFSHHGVHVALELVTEQAGVSRATLYRNFPDREALMAALLERAFTKLEALAKQLDQSEDGLYIMLGHMASLVSDSAPVSDHWRATDRDGPVLADAQRRLARMMKPLLQRAIAAGICRADLTPKDVVLATSMLGCCLLGRTQAERRSLAKRALALLTDGLRASTLPKRIAS